MMTLVIIAVTDFGIAQVSDRRLTVGAKVHRSNYNKSFYVGTQYSRFIVGFTDLAAAGKFSLIPFLLESLSRLSHDSVVDGHSLADAIRCILQDKFDSDSNIFRLSQESKWTEVSVSGYISGSRLLILYKISNWDGGLVPFEVLDVDHIFMPDGRIGFLSVLGTMSAVTADRLKTLSQRIIGIKSLNACRDVIAAMLRNIASDRRSGVMIGGHTDWLTLSSSDGFQASAGNYSSEVSDRVHFPSSITFSTSGNRYVHEMSLKCTNVSTGKPVLSVPIVRQNHLCPCGSLKRYKHCHKPGRLMIFSLANLENTPSNHPNS